jgi:uncharacterized protein
MIRAGVLSDTHINTINQRFKDSINAAFSACELIFHAGDITNLAVLEIFQPKTVYAVHGNMCDAAVCKSLPESRIVQLENRTIGLCHGAGPRHNIEERMWARFPEADCIIYGHTHQPVCHYMGDILFINPGSFQISTPYGAPASYAILTLDDTGCHAKLHTLASKQ